MKSFILFVGVILLSIGSKAQMFNLMMAQQGKKANNGTPITAIGNITGSLFPTYTLSAGATTPSNATKTYQWSRSTTPNGTYTDVSYGTSSSLYLYSSDAGYYFKVSVTGSGAFSGTVTSNPTSSPVIGTLYYNYTINSYVARDNCGTGYVGSSVYVYIAPNTYTSYGYQYLADGLAWTAAQNYANANGVCNQVFWNNNSYSGGAQKNDCPSGYTGSYVYGIYVGPGSVSGPTQDAANNAIWSLVYEQANAQGSCNWTGYESNQFNKYIQKNNCPGGNGSWVMCFAPNGMYVSQNSQAEADAWAQAALDGAYGQDLANEYGTCN